MTMPRDRENASWVDLAIGVLVLIAGGSVAIKLVEWLDAGVGR